MTSFGGPVGHLGYFCSEFVVRRQWLDERAFSDLVAFCQFLPGPASSQVGFSIGLLRASYGAALAAWLGFTLPSVVAIVCFAVLSALAGTAGEGPLHGLTLVAGLVVAQAVIGMGRTLRPDAQRALIAIVAALIALIAPGYFAEPTTIAFGAAAGLSLCRALPESAAWTVASPVSRRTGLGSVALFVALLVAPPILHRLNDSAALARADAFYRSGAHVFGGSHIVLPLLLEALVAPGWVADRTFLAGCGAAQACPGRCLQSPRISAQFPSRRPRVGRRRARARARARARQHLPAGSLAGDGRTTVLEPVPVASPRRIDVAWRECSGRRAPWRGALQSGIDEFDPRTGWRRHRARRLCAADGVARAASRRLRPLRTGRVRVRLNTGCEARKLFRRVCSSMHGLPRSFAAAPNQQVPP